MQNRQIFFHFVFVHLFFFNAGAQVPSWQWERKMGSLYDDDPYYSIIDSSGNIYTIGFYQGTADFDPGPGTYNLYAASFGSIDNIFISKLDANGNLVWAKSIGDEDNSEIAYGIAIDASGNIYVTGIFADTTDFDPDSAGVFQLIPVGDGDVFILKLDSSGNFIWAKQFGGPYDDSPEAIAVDDAANVYTVGTFYDSCDFDPDSFSVFTLTSQGLLDIFISKLDSSGNFIWAKQFNGTSGAEGSSIAIDPFQNVLTTGWFQDTVDFDPGSGVVQLISGNFGDMFVSKLDSNGDFIWVKDFGDSSSAVYGWGITTDETGNVYSTGHFFGSVDFDTGPGISILSSAGGEDIYLLKLNGSGEFLWGKKMGGPNGDTGYSIAVDQHQNVYCTGFFESSADFDPDSLSDFILVNSYINTSDIFVSKLDSAGNFAWAKSISGASNDLGNSVIVDDNGNVYLSGFFKSQTLEFDSILLSNTGGTANDIWVAKLGSSLNTPVIYPDEYNLHFSVYPNPAASYIMIKNAAGCVVTIFNLIGEIVMKFSIHSNDETINCENLPPGIYFVQIQNKNGASIQKLIKQ